MTWKKVLIFAAAAAVLTAAMLVIPFTKDTSLANIGVSFECWILFALVIIMNSEKPLEAGLKTFVFFLISQPLIYLLQVPFSRLGFHIFMYYKNWILYTALCFPGAMAAWYVKKDNILSALILSAATGLLGLEFVDYLSQCIGHFPKNLLTVIFIAALIAVLILTLLKSRRGRIVAAAITLAVMIGFGVIAFSDRAAPPPMGCSYYLGSGHTWEITSVEGDIGSIGMNDEGYLVEVSPERYGDAKVTLTNEEGDTVTLTVTYDEENGTSIERDE